MKRLTIKCVVCLMFGIANTNYMIRPDFKLENMKLCYWVMSKICKGGGGQNMFPYFWGYLLCVEAYRIYCKKLLFTLSYNVL